MEDEMTRNRDRLSLG